MTPTAGSTASRKSYADVFPLIRPHLHGELRKYLILRTLKKDLKDTVFGFGPLQDLLRAPNDQRNHGRAQRPDLRRARRRDRAVGPAVHLAEVTESIIERIVAQVGRRIDKSQPLVDARLPDGCRVNAIIPPLAVRGPCLTIRKFGPRQFTIDDLIERGSITRPAASSCGPASSTSATSSSAAAPAPARRRCSTSCRSFIPHKQRIVTIEDTTELQLHQEHVVTLESKPANVEGTGAYTIRDLVKNALRMRPDRIIVGECRGPEALDMLQAMNTGHDGSLTTVHANSAEEVLQRLEVLVLMAVDLPVPAIHRQIESAIDVIVQISRMSGGKRAVDADLRGGRRRSRDRPRADSRHFQPPRRQRRACSRPVTCRRSSIG